MATALLVPAKQLLYPTSEIASKLKPYFRIAPNNGSIDFER
jgi:hypothetical protein